MITVLPQDLRAFNKVTAIFTAALLLVAITTTLPTSSTAKAGTYTVVACDDATDQGYTDANNSWEYSISLETSIYRSATTDWWTAFEGCPSDSGPDPTVLDATLYDGLYITDSGIGVRDTSGSPDRGGKPTAEYTFTAPTGAVITGFDANRWMGKKNDLWNTYFLANSTVLEECTGSTTCSLYGDLNESFSSEDAVSSLTFGFDCNQVSTLGCQNATSSTVDLSGHSVWAIIYGASVVLEEGEFPVLSGVVGSLVDAAGGVPLTGVVGVSFVGSDGVSGVASGSLVVDVGTGSEVTADSEGFVCDYTFTQPCSRDSSGSASGSLTLDPTMLSDGTHTVQVCVSDAAENETCGEQWSVEVDNTPPAAPLGPVATDKGDGSVEALWDAPDTSSDKGTELTEAVYLICSPDDTGCSPISGEPTGSVDITDGTTSVTGISGKAGDIFYLWFRDAAGHDGEYAVTTIQAMPVEPVVTGEGPASTSTPPSSSLSPLLPIKTVTSPPPTPIQAVPVTPVLVDPLVKIRKVKAQKRKVTVNGTCSSSLSGLQIYLAFKTKGNRTAKKTVVCNGGVWKAKLKLRLKKSYKKATLTVTTNQTATTTATTQTKTIKRKR